MAIDPEETAPKKAKTLITVGEDISTFSVFELEVRVGELEAEIKRTREAIAARSGTRNAADALFKR